MGKRGSVFEGMGAAEQFLVSARLLGQQAKYDAQKEGAYEDPKQARREYFAKKIIAATKDIKRFQIKSGENCSGIKPTDQPYSRAGSYQFFMDVKMARESEVKQALERDRFLAH